MYKCGPLSDEKSTQEIRQKIRSWLQKIRAIRGGEENACPVILVGTHLDSRLPKTGDFDPHDIESVSAHFSAIENFRYQEEMQTIFSEYKEVEGGYETSSAFLVNVQGAMIAAHRTVLFPMSPIYDSESKRLTPKFVDRLKRIFTLCDLDGDGALNESEIQYFNHRTFDEKIPEKDLQQVQRVAKYNNANYVDSNDGIKFEGFLFWITVFVEKQEEEVAWSVLYEWGYNRNLNLSQDFLFPNDDVYHLGTVKDAEIAAQDMWGPDPHVAQISKEGIRFLQSSLFERYMKKDGSALLSVAQLGHMFQTLADEKNSPEVLCPFDLEEISQGRVVPLAGASHDHEDACVDFNSFLGLWNSLLTNNVESIQTLVRCATFLGYQHERDDHTALFVKWCYQPERQSRTLFHVLVLSAPSEGNVSKALVSRLSGVSNPGNKGCVGQIGDEKFIRFQMAINDGQLTVENASHFDLVVFAFENSVDSVQYCHNYAQQINKDSVLRLSLPMIFVYVPTNDDEKNNAKVLSNQICRSLGLPLPLPVACEEDWSFFRNCFNNCLLVNSADYKIPSRNAFKMLFGGLVFIGLGVAGYFLYTKYLEAQESKD